MYRARGGSTLSALSKAGRLGNVCRISRRRNGLGLVHHLLRGMVGRRRVCVGLGGSS